MQVERAGFFREGSEWRTGEEHVGDLPSGEEYQREIVDNTACASLEAKLLVLRGALR